MTRRMLSLTDWVVDFVAEVAVFLLVAWPTSVFLICLVSWSGAFEHVGWPNPTWPQTFLLAYFMSVMRGRS